MCVCVCHALHALALLNLSRLPPEPWPHGDADADVSGQCMCTPISPRTSPPSKLLPASTVHLPLLLVLMLVLARPHTPPPQSIAARGHTLTAPAGGLLLPLESLKFHPSSHVHLHVAAVAVVYGVSPIGPRMAGGTPPLNCCSAPFTCGTLCPCAHQHHPASCDYFPADDKLDIRAMLAFRDSLACWARFFAAVSR